MPTYTLQIFGLLLKLYTKLYTSGCLFTSMLIRFECKCKDCCCICPRELANSLINLCWSCLLLLLYRSVWWLLDEGLELD